MTISKSKFWQSLDSFTKAYIECLLWQAGEDDKGNTIDSNYDQFSLTMESLKRIKADCEKFQKLAGDRITKEENYLLAIPHSIIEQAAHDFCLTRNHHGCGFWEEYDWKEEIGKKLTDLSHTFPPDNIFPRNKKILDAFAM